MDDDRPSVLVVDDESLPRTLLRTCLNEAGYQTLEANCGRDALEQLREHVVDVVLLDLVMPEMDGFQVLKTLQADDRLRHIPVVVVSASDDMNSVVRCIEMGAVDHLSKPFDPVLLHVRVRSALALKRVKASGPADRTTIGGRLRRRLIGTEAQDTPDADETRMGSLAFLRALLGLGRPYRNQQIVVLLLMLVALGIEAALPLGFKFITDNALLARNLQLLILTVVIMLTLLAAAAIFQVSGDFLYVRMTTSILNDLRFNMYRHLQHLSMRFYARVQAGVITSRFTTDLAAVESTAMLTVPLALGRLVLVAFSLLFLFLLAWKLALGAIVGLCAGYLVERRVEKTAARADTRMKEQQGAISSVLQESISAQPVITLFRLQGMVTERFKHQMIQFYRTAARAYFLSNLTEHAPGRVVALCSMAIIAAGAFLTYYGRLTIGELISFQVLLAGLTSAVGDVTWSLPHFVRAAGGMQKIQQLLHEAPQVVDSQDAIPLPRPTREIAFHDVTFGYTDGHADLRNVSLTIPVGQSVLLIGPSGSGKSTVLNLIMRLYDPQHGSVTIDGHDLRQITQDSLRQNMSVVLQESFLFNTTIRENIRMGRQGATDEEVEAAARAVGIHDRILGMPNGYDTPVGERGGSLSGGQRQRLTIARAVLSDPAILLLDDATSAMDPEAAAAISAVLERIGKGRTVISVTHRLESAPTADRIFLFQDGSLAESGCHEELLRRGGLYLSLWQSQTGFAPEGQRLAAHA